MSMSKPVPHEAGFAEFASYYDLIYGDKDYPAEVGLFDRLVKRYAAGDIESVLDAGCGTGGHSLGLAELGYRVCGADRSESMLQVARGKPQPAGNPVEWVQQDLRSLDLDRKFDACGAFFAVLSFQLENADMADALARLRRHLAPGGLLLGDVWYGPTVLSQGLENRLKVIEAEGHRVLKYATPELDTFRHTNVVHQHVIVMDRNAKIVNEFEERQEVRFFFPQELVAFLEQAGFEVLRFFAYPDESREPTSSDWDLGFVARVREGS
jgi:SAM-dependent methyltransferase